MLKLVDAKPEFEQYVSYNQGQKNMPARKSVGPLDSEAHLSKFKDSKADINDKHKNIWNIITNRYLRSAYPAFSDDN